MKGDEKKEKNTALSKQKLKKEKQFSDSDKSSDSSDLDIKLPSKNINKTAPIQPKV